MSEIKKSSKPDVSLVFLKWLVIVLSVVMVLGFLFLVIILGIKIYNFNTTTQNLTEPSNRDILIPDGKIESVDVGNDVLTIVLEVGVGQLEILVINLEDGTLLNQYSVKQKKSLYNKWTYFTNLKYYVFLFCLFRKN